MTAQSLRSKIMDAIVAGFQASTHDLYDTPKPWDTVTTQPTPSKVQVEKGPCLMICDGKETKNELVGYTMCRLSFTTEFQLKGFRGDDMSELSRRALTVIQLQVFSDRQVGGLALDIQEERNELDLDDHAVNSAAGIISWVVVYRHKTGDPTSRP